MKALIIYDSFFGNTEQVARAVGRGLGAPESVRVVRVGGVTAEALRGASVVVVGSPTRGFRPSGAIHKFLKGLPAGALSGAQVAAFDTRISTTDVNNRLLNTLVRMLGFAAEPIGKKLAQKGGQTASAPEGFFVKGTEGPLKEGELERATTWGTSIAKHVV